MESSINIKKDTICIFGIDYKLPITIEKIKETLGQGIAMNLFNGTPIYVWQDIGIYAWINEDIVTGLRIELTTSNSDICKKNFKGEILINTKKLDEIKWKKEDYDSVKKYKIGEFKLYLEENLNFLEIEFKKEKIKDKCNKYEIKKLKEPNLKFENFNFKLCIIQELMYNKNILKPKFDVYDFIEEYNKRKINIEDEGYQIIKEVADWFENLEIPISLAKYIDEIIMDGGNEIYGQIIPFWDGEDDCFDIVDIIEEEIKQFPNLKKIILLPSKNNIKLIEKIKGYGIEVKEL